LKIFQKKRRIVTLINVWTSLQSLTLLQGLKKVKAMTTSKSPRDNSAVQFAIRISQDTTFNVDKSMQIAVPKRRMYSLIPTLEPMF
jgi:hypothetical protein